MIATGPDGFPCFVTSAGVIRFDGQRMEPITGSKLASAAAPTIHATGNGRLWVGGPDRLVCHDGVAWSVLDEWDGMQDGWANDVLARVGPCSQGYTPGAPDEARILPTAPPRLPPQKQIAK